MHINREIITGYTQGVTAIESAFTMWHFVGGAIIANDVSS